MDDRSGEECVIVVPEGGDLSVSFDYFDFFFVCFHYDA